MKIIPYGRQYIDEDDINAVIDVLRSVWLTCGPKVKEFEDALCKYTGAKYAVAVSSGTAALHIAVAALELGDDWEGITTPNTFLASANSIIYNNGRPVFADIEEDTHNISVSEIEKRISSKTRLIIPIDFAGHPCEMDAIYNLAKKRNIYVIRDACHSIGSLFKGEKTGSCMYSDMTIFSFHPVKHITTGEGGAILTNNAEIYEKLLMLRNHGMTKDEELLTSNPGPWYYEMHMLGFNYRITDLQCALGISQLKKLDRFIKRRREIVDIYNRELGQIKYITIPIEKDYAKSSYHLYPVEIDFEKIGITREEFMLALKDKGILTQVHYIPIHLQPYYRKRFSYKPGDYPVAENYYERALSLPLYPAMTDEDVAIVIKALRELL